MVYHRQQQQHPIFSPNPPANYHLQNYPLVIPPRNSNRISYNFTPFPEPLSHLLLKLLNANLIRNAHLKISLPPRGYNSNLHYAFHMDTPGHDTNNCLALKNKCRTWLTAKPSQSHPQPPRPSVQIPFLLMLPSSPSINISSDDLLLTLHSL